jgi:hypothetical protein
VTEISKSVCPREQVVKVVNSWAGVACYGGAGGGG